MLEMRNREILAYEPIIRSATAGYGHDMIVQGSVGDNVDISPRIHMLDARTMPAHHTPLV